MSAAETPPSFSLPTRPTFPVPKAAQSAHQKIEKQAQKLVADTFYGTLMRQMHDSPFKSELFSGGRGGEAFGGLYDQQLTERMAKAGGNKLVNGIVRRIEARQAYAKQKKQEQQQTGSTKEGMDATNNAKLRGDRGNDGAAATAVPAALRA